ncbi:hypothetical protein B0T24DRAFT_624757 [Lasiosphaeria ovina]|uniref:Secreted protein n=1 Tax=Lasiosphaeria ovina TaxID=92902 RepID=A0AAE0KCU8_9PEZI|nr:hypothetical protein B0T24DRAFT_624757 [Lasiosphaeria ovina]
MHRWTSCSGRTLNSLFVLFSVLFSSGLSISRLPSKAQHDLALSVTHAPGLTLDQPGTRPLNHLSHYSLYHHTPAAAAAPGLPVLPHARARAHTS